MKLYQVIDHAGKQFHINPEHVSAIDWESKRMVFSNDESIYFRTGADIIDACNKLGLELEDGE